MVTGSAYPGKLFVGGCSFEVGTPIQGEELFYAPVPFVGRRFREDEAP
jgi:hypothetical protein